jgi:hypothetical protein
MSGPVGAGHLNSVMLSAGGFGVLAVINLTVAGLCCFMTGSFYFWSRAGRLIRVARLPPAIGHSVVRIL